MAFQKDILQKICTIQGVLILYPTGFLKAHLMQSETKECLRNRHVSRTTYLKRYTARNLRQKISLCLAM
uniref:Uncharacterized protein n=1 Tax=Arundo donax TaxID=35708 RepID=A0A0A9B0G3_ARUDO